MGQPFLTCWTWKRSQISVKCQLTGYKQQRHSASRAHITSTCCLVSMWYRLIPKDFEVGVLLFLKQCRLNTWTEFRTETPPWHFLSEEELCNLSQETGSWRCSIRLRFPSPSRCIDFLFGIYDGEKRSDLSLASFGTYTVQQRFLNLSV